MPIDTEETRLAAHTTRLQPQDGTINVNVRSTARHETHQFNERIDTDGTTVKSTCLVTLV